MKSELRSILIPCEVLEVRAICAPSKTLTPLDILVIEAIGRSDSLLDLDQIVAMFGIGLRPTLDLVQDLWNGGHISVDPAKGHLALTAATRRLLQENRLNEIETALRSEQRVRVMRELICGHVIHWMRPAQNRPATSVPPELEASGGRLTEQQHAEMLGVVEGALQKTFARQPLRLIDAVPIVDRGPSTLAALAVRAAVTRHPETGDLGFTLLRPTRITSRVRDRLAKRLENIAREKPKIHVFRNLAAFVSATSDTTVAPLAATLRELREACEQMQSAEDQEVPSRHAACETAASTICDRLRDQASRDAQIDVLAGAPSIHDAIREAIRAAKQQVVLVCPYASWDGYERFANDLREAMKRRGVRVVVIWGIDDSRPLDARFAAGLMQLQAEAPLGVVLRSTQGARVHGKIVICDGDCAVIGTNNYLDSGKHAAELAIRIRGVGPGGSEPVTDLLEWARRIAPDAAMRAAISVPAVTRKQVTLPPIPEPPTPSGAGGFIEPAALRVKAVACRASWQRFLRAISQFVSDAPPTCDLVTGQDHRRLLLNAIQTARWRLLIASDRLSSEAIDSLVQGRLQERLAMGLPVAIVWRRSRVTDPIEENLQRLASEFPNLTLVKGETHAKVVVWDNDAVVSSFNFLSFGGDDDAPRAHRLTHETGMRVGSRAIADRIVEGLVRQLDGLLPWLRAVVAPAIETVQLDAEPVRQSKTGIQALLDDIAAVGQDRRARVRALNSFFATTLEAEAALEVLADAGRVGREIADEALTAALRHHPGPSLPRRWVEPLTASLWSARRFFDAAALLSAAEDGTDGDDSAGVPSLSAAMLGAAGPSDTALAQHLEELATGPRPGATTLECAASLGAFHLASRGSPLVADALSAFADAAGSQGARLADAVLNGWWAGSTGVAVPFEAVLDTTRAQLALHQQDAAYKELKQTLWRGLRPHAFPAFEPGEKTLVNIFGPQGELRPVYQAAERGDAEEVERLLKAIGTVEDVVAAAWERVPLRPRLLMKPFRPSIERTTAAAMDAARAWAKVATRVAATLRPDELDGLRGMRARLAPIWTDLEARDGVAGVPIRMCMELFVPVMHWNPEGT